MKKLMVAFLIIICAMTGCGRNGNGTSAAPEEHAPVNSGSVPNVEPSGQSSLEGKTSEALPPTVRLTVPEGYTLARIGMTLEEMEICTAEEFVAASEALDVHDYSLLMEQPEDPGRCFALEGYLYPDTYEIYINEEPAEIIRRMLANMEGKINDALRGEIAQSGYGADEILAMASIIEKEAFGPEQMPLISSVLHNRLEIGMRLQCDVTRSYVRNVIAHFAEAPEQYETFYDTYQCAALPAGAICNPSLQAIQAALRPAESDYYYFVTDSEGSYYYGETWEDHLVNIEMAESVNRKAEETEMK